MELITHSIEQTEEYRFQGHLDQRNLFSPANGPQHSYGQHSINGQMADLINAGDRWQVEGVARLMGEKKNNPHHKEHGGYAQKEKQLIPSD